LLQEQPSSQIQYNSSTPEENTNNSSLSSIIVDLGIKQGDSDESTWENINTRLHMIFGHTNQLKTPINDNDKEKYLQLIHALKHSKFINKFSVDTWVNKAENTFDENDDQGQITKEWLDVANALNNPESDDLSLQVNVQNNSIYFNLGNNCRSFNFENRLDFGDEIKSISEGFDKWNKIELLAKSVSEEVTHYRLNHFLKLIDRYLALFKFASQETPEEYKNCSDNQKIVNGIALGRDKSSHLKLNWVKFHIRKFLEIVPRSENKMYNALWCIKFIVDNQIKTTKELAKAGGSPRFFQNLSNDEFNRFLSEITGGISKSSLFLTK
ncbi:23720_t:CDS:2, partial [Gigaspora rosea]